MDAAVGFPINGFNQGYLDSQLLQVYLINPLFISLKAPTGSTDSPVSVHIQRASRNKSPYATSFVVCESTRLTLGVLLFTSRENLNDRAAKFACEPWEVHTGRAQSQNWGRHPRSVL
jgi:hypothetical protein